MTPDDGNAVMSQSDIDAMISSATDIGSETPAPAQVAPEEPAAAAPAEPAAPAAGDGAALTDVIERLAKLEAAVSKLKKDGGGQGPALAKNVKALGVQLDEIAQHLPNTLGYGVRASFQCASCTAQGLVAARVFCTHCGTETALGWWAQT